MQFTEDEELIIEATKPIVLSKMSATDVYTFEKDDLLDLIILRIAQDITSGAMGDNMPIRLFNAFIWDNTPEGHDFWSAIESNHVLKTQ